MENKEKTTSQEWEIEVKERFAQADERQVLDLAQHIAVQLAAVLGEARIMARDPEAMPDEIEDTIRTQIGRMAVMLDVLQLRYCDCADEELAFLKDIEGCLEE